MSRCPLGIKGARIAMPRESSSGKRTTMRNSTEEGRNMEVISMTPMKTDSPPVEAPTIAPAIAPDPSRRLNPDELCPGQKTDITRRIRREVEK